MNRIEDDLKAALRRKPAPDGFAAKVLEKAESGAFRNNIPRRFVRSRFWLAAAAVVMLTVGISTFEYQQHVRARNEAALQRALAALSIAATQLDQAGQKAFEQNRWERISRQLAGLTADRDR